MRVRKLLKYALYAFAFAFLFSYLGEPEASIKEHFTNIIWTAVCATLVFLFGLFFTFVYDKLAPTIRGKYNSYETDKEPTEKEITHKALGCLCAMVTMSEGRVDKSERKIVINYMRSHFDREHSNQIITEFNHCIENSYSDLDANFEQNIAKAVTKLNDKEKLTLAELFFDIANAADGILPSERDLLQRIMEHIGLAKKDRDYLKHKYETCFRQEKEDKKSEKESASKEPDTRYYHILGLELTATKEEVRIAYRTLAKKYHPDKVQKQTLKLVMEEKFKEITNAYEKLS